PRCVHRPAPPPVSTLSLHDAFRSERSRSLAFCTFKCFFHLFFFPHQAHALATAAGSCFQQYRVSHFVAQFPGFFSILQQALGTRSEEHTSELQSRENLVCRLLLEK